MTTNQQTMTFTCPSCKETFRVGTAYIERREREGQPVLCPICNWTLIKNEREENDHPTTT